MKSLPFTKEWGCVGISGIVNVWRNWGWGMSAVGDSGEGAPLLGEIMCLSLEESTTVPPPYQKLIVIVIPNNV